MLLIPKFFRATLNSFSIAARCLLILLFICSCTQKTQTDVYCVEANVSQEQIVEQIEKAISVMVKGIENKNAEEIFSIFDTTSNVQYVRQGHIYSNIADAISNYKDAFAKSPSNESRKFHFGSKKFDIVNQNTVLFTGIGVIETFKGDKAINEPWKIGYTILWLKSSLGWRAINMHISW